LGEGSVELYTKEAVRQRVAPKTTRSVGLDVYTHTITEAIAEKDSEVRSEGMIPNRSESIKRLVTKLDAEGPWTACYEAGPTGYALYW
jgi:transposase